MKPPNRKTTKHDSLLKNMALIDRGANGCILGDECKIVYAHRKMINVNGILSKELVGLRIVDALAKVGSHKGDILLRIGHSASHPGGKTILSPVQIEDHGNLVEDRPISAQGAQCMVLKEGYVIPINYINGLPYIEIHKPTIEDCRNFNLLS